MYRFVAPILLVVSTLSHAAETTLATQCLGAKGGKHHAIYLHGFLDPGASNQNSELAIVDRVAKELDLVIAAPRSQSICGLSPKLCWEQSRAAAVKLTWEQVKDASANCFPWSQDVGLIGFSNGGFFGGKLLLACPSDAPAWIVAMGSAGAPQTKVPPTLAPCPPITLMIGTRDQSFSIAKEFFGKLVDRGARAQFRQFSGGHEIKEDGLRTALVEFLQPAPTPTKK